MDLRGRSGDSSGNIGGTSGEMIMPVQQASQTLGEEAGGVTGRMNSSWSLLSAKAILATATMSGKDGTSNSRQPQLKLKTSGGSL